MVLCSHVNREVAEMNAVLGVCLVVKGLAHEPEEGQAGEPEGAGAQHHLG